MSKNSLVKSTTKTNPKGRLNHVALNLIKVVPGFNERGETGFRGEKFDELVDSIQTNDVVQPILLRDMGPGKPYNLVAGERRFRAKSQIAKANGGLAKNTIPAIIRILTDSQAKAIMLLENMQREDLTPLEEARGFKKYVDNAKNSAIAVTEIADKIGKKESFIQRRLAVIHLPEDILDAWDQKILTFGYLEQFIRLPESDQLELFGELMQQHGQGYNLMSVKSIKRKIDNRSPKLNTALFDTKSAGCPGCKHNSDQQKALFGLDFADDVQCENPKCFKINQIDHLEQNWDTHPSKKANGTRGFRFYDDVGYDGFQSITKPYPECKKCEHFVSLLDQTGDQVQGKACIGEKKCMKTLEKVRQDGKTAKKAGRKPKSAKQIQQEEIKIKAARRANNHAVEFREKLFEKAIPERIERTMATSDKVNKLALISILTGNSDAGRWFREQTDKDFEPYDMPYTPDEIVRKVKAMNHKRVQTLLRDVTSVVVGTNRFDPPGRLELSKMLGINLKQEFLITDEFLQKKTKPELLDLGDSLKIFKQKVVQDHLNVEIRKSLDGCTKDELISLFMDSGVNLKGKVPPEVITAAAIK